MNNFFTATLASILLSAATATSAVECPSKAKIAKQPKEKTPLIQLPDFNLDLPEHIDMGEIFSPSNFSNGNKAIAKDNCKYVFPGGKCETVVIVVSEEAAKNYFDSENKVERFNPDNIDPLDYK